MYAAGLAPVCRCGAPSVASSIPKSASAPVELSARSLSEHAYIVDIGAVANSLRTGPGGRASPVRRAFSGAPGRLIALGAGLVAAVVVLIAVVAAGMAGARGAVSANATKAAEVGAANDLVAHLSDMDAQAANALLVGFNPAVPVPAIVGASAAMRTYETDRIDVDHELQLIGLNPALAAADARLLDTLGVYESMIGQAIYIDQNTRDQSPAAPPGGALALYERASNTMREDLLTHAAGIRDQDRREIDERYGSAHGSANAYTVAIVALGALTLALLIGAHLHLSRAFRRIITPALVLAALVVIPVTACAATDLSHEAHDYEIAKVDAFDSLSALTNAEAASYGLNADESRWLLDRLPQNQQGFYTSADQIARVSGLSAEQAAADPATYYNGLADAVDSLTMNPTRNTVTGVTISGVLGVKLGSIVFGGEAQRAYDAFLAFRHYIHDDLTIRQNASAGDVPAAVAFDVGQRQGNANYDFSLYTGDLQKTIDINEHAFTAAVSASQSSLAVWTWLPYLIGVLLLALITAALHPRLREYR